MVVLIKLEQNQGGSNKFRNLFGYDLIQKSPGYWTDEIIIDELKTIIAITGNFPSGKALKKIGKGNLVRAINRHGGFNKFRASLKCKPLKQSNGFWTEEQIIRDLNTTVIEIKYFPTQIELNNLGKKDLVAAIGICGGLSKFRKEMGHELLVKPDGYWDDENNITNELKIIIKKIGHFPTQPELKEMDKQDLSQAIRIHGGSDKFRKLLGCELLKKPLGYWTDEVVINELKPITDNLGYFPTCNELRDMGRSDLETQINVNGGILKFQELSGFPVSDYDRFRSELASYTVKRGKNTEKFVKEILLQWSKTHNKPDPIYNVKLADGNVLEFVCDLGKKIGIDVTNTKGRTTFQTIREKWRKKEYYQNLDELWIVVFSDTITREEYDELNSECPKEVKIFSIRGFLDEIKYSTDSCTMNKLGKLEECTFRTKEELKGKNLSQ